MKNRTKHRKYRVFSKSRLRFPFIFWNLNRTDFTVNRTWLVQTGQVAGGQPACVHCYLLTNPARISLPELVIQPACVHCYLLTNPARISLPELVIQPVFTVICWLTSLYFSSRVGDPACVHCYLLTNPARISLPELVIQPACVHCYLLTNPARISLPELVIQPACVHCYLLTNPARISLPELVIQPACVHCYLLTNPARISLPELVIQPVFTVISWLTPLVFLFQSWWSSRRSTRSWSPHTPAPPAARRPPPSARRLTTARRWPRLQRTPRRRREPRPLGTRPEGGEGAWRTHTAWPRNTDCVVATQTNNVLFINHTTFWF